MTRRFCHSDPIETTNLFLRRPGNGAFSRRYPPSLEGFRLKLEARRRAGTAVAFEASLVEDLCAL